MLAEASSWPDAIIALGSFAFLAFFLWLILRGIWDD